MKKTSERKYIKIRGANEHNLKNIDVDIPRDEFVVLTGLSGSGKSSLAFDTIYAEGQRRYMESLSSYARQFLGQMEKPNVEKIEGLSPAISIDQKSTNRNPRSTVGTVTEIYDYFRLLYARIGVPHCPKCGKEIKKQTVDQMVDQIMELPERTKIQLLAPVVRGRKGEHQKLFEQAKRSGYVRVIVDGSMYELSEEIKLDKNKKHNIEIVVDRLMVKEGIEKRLADSIENVLTLANGLMTVDVIGGEPIQFSESFSCPDCGISIGEIEPRSFSFNNPFGACPTCFGLGYKMEFDEDLMIPDKRLSIAEGAIQVMGWQSCTDPSSFTYAILKALTEEYHFSLETPYCEYPEEIRHVLIYGTDGREVKVHYRGQRGEGVYDVAFEGLIKNVQRKYRETGSEVMKQEYEQFMRITPCETCKGQRLKAESLAVTVADKNIYEMTSMSVKNLNAFLAEMKLGEQQHRIGDQILKEIRARVGFLNEVGPDYLSLSVFLLILNVPLFLFGLKKQGTAFTVYSLFAVAVYSAASWIIVDVLPVDVSFASPLAGEDLLLCALFGGVISGVGSGLTIRYGGAIDGVEVMAVIFAKKLSLTVGTFVMIYNVILYILCGSVMHSWILPLYSIVAYGAGLKTVDFVVEGIDRSKEVMIVTDKAEEISAALMEAFECGTTKIAARGGYSDADKTIIYFVVNRFQICEQSSAPSTRKRS